MQTVSIGENLHEISKPIFLGKKKSAENFIGRSDEQIDQFIVGCRDGEPRECRYLQASLVPIREQKQRGRVFYFLLQDRQCTALSSFRVCLHESAKML